MLIEREGVVAIWLGQLASQEELMAYLEERYGTDAPISAFAVDLQVSFYDHDFLERSYHAQPAPIDAVLSHHSYSDTFVEEATTAAKAAGVTRANASIILLNHALEEGAAWPNDAPVTYIGAVPYALPLGPSSPALRPDDHEARVLVATILDNGRYAFTGARGGSVKLWDLAQNVCLDTSHGHGDWIRVLTSKHGQTLCAGDSVTLLNAGASGLNVTRLDDREFNTWVAIFSREGRRAAIGARQGQINIWDVADRSCVRTVDHGEHHTLNAAFASEQRLVASDNEGQLHCWNVDTGDLLWTARDHVGLKEHYQTPVHGIWPLGDALLAQSSVSLALLDAATGRCIWLEQSKVSLSTFLPVPAAGIGLSAGDADGLVHVWDLQTGKQRTTLTGHTAMVTALAVHPDARFVFSGDRDGLTIAWDLHSLQAVSQYPASAPSRPLVEAWLDDPYAVSCIAASANHVVVGEFSGRVHLLEWTGTALHPRPR